MTERIAGFKGEYLWELEVAEHHLMAIAAAIPADRYDWRPAERSRSVSEVLVHVSTGNFALLDCIGVGAPVDLYGTCGEQGIERLFALVAKNQALEKEVVDKAGVIALLGRALGCVRSTLTTSEELDRVGMFFGEQTTVRRVYLRMLAHTHEHMGQMIGYVRMMGMKAPWPDPLDEINSEDGRAEIKRAHERS